jgi:hypothetical protein
LLPLPSPVQLAEAPVAISLGLALAILFPEKLQRHILVALQLAMDGGEIDGPPDRWTATRRCSGKKQFIQSAIVPILGERQLTANATLL